MRYAVCGSSAVILLLVLSIAPVSAHHPIEAKFDPAQPATLSGLVTGIDWSNPHVHIFLNVQEPNGQVSRNWAVELESPLDLARSGWSRDTLKPGDVIDIQGFAARDGSRQVWATSVVLAGSGARVFALDPSKALPAAATDTRPTPRWPSGQPRLGPPPGESGYWANPGAAMLIETGADVEVRPYGLLANIEDVDKVAPFQPWARDLFEYRQRNFLKDDPLFLFCIPPGGPRQFQRPNGFQFIEDPDRERIFMIDGGGNFNWRLIYLDGREQVGDPRGDADNPLYYGRAVAHWEGDTLVVDTKGFNERFWFSNGGLPHTEQLHLIERFSRPDFNTLQYEVTINDPGAYTRSWSSSWTLQWIPEELPEYLCQDNRP